MFVAMAPILVPAAIWIYTLVFAFSSLWFAHYLLAALEQVREKNNALVPAPPAQEATKSIANELPAEAFPEPEPRLVSLGDQPDSRP
jgi:hypothetical protein